MKKSQRIQSVTNVIAFKERQAALVLGQVRGALSMEQARLIELINYRSEYMQEFQRKGRQGIDAQQLMSYQDFIDKLNIAINEQGKVIAEAQVIVDQKNTLWNNTRLRVKVYDKVMNRYQFEENKLEIQQEQKSNDEIASQIIKKT